jgi:hypothetical protein
MVMDMRSHMCGTCALFFLPDLENGQPPPLVLSLF